MTATEKKSKILAAAASFGHNADIYLTEAKELANEGLIVLVHTYTATGRSVYRWKLAA